MNFKFSFFFLLLTLLAIESYGGQCYYEFAFVIKDGQENKDDQLPYPHTKVVKGFSENKYTRDINRKIVQRKNSVTQKYEIVANIQKRVGSSAACEGELKKEISGALNGKEVSLLESYYINKLEYDGEAVDFGKGFSEVPLPMKKPDDLVNGKSPQGAGKASRRPDPPAGGAR